MSGGRRTVVDPTLVGPTLAVRVSVATVWTSPAAPRPIDAPAVADEPDPVAWTARLDRPAGGEGRLGLHGRTSTQLLRGEPVRVLEECDGWSRVAALWQPSSLHPDGYPGWVRSTHLEPCPDAPALGEVAAEPRREQVLDTARELLGVAYLWGGTSPAGLDCSGLVHLVLRGHGLRAPRDAHDQAVWPGLRPVPPQRALPGDLYFFASGTRVDHVAFATSPGAGSERWMLHAPEGGAVEEVPMSRARAVRLSGAGRLAGWPDGRVRGG